MKYLFTNIHYQGHEYNHEISLEQTMNVQWN